MIDDKQQKVLQLTKEMDDQAVKLERVQKQNSTTMTSCLLGCFRSDARTRGEFLGLVQNVGR